MNSATLLDNFDLLAEAPGGVPKLRELILQLAVQGRLVPHQGEWPKANLRGVAERIHYGYTASANPSIKDVRLLRITDIQENRVNWDTVPGCEIESANVRKYELHPGDILIARTGGTIGKTFLISDTPVHAVFASYLIRVIPSPRVLPPYLKLFLESPDYWEQLRLKSAGTGQPNVNGQALGSLELNLPPLPEQKRIVARVDELMKRCDELEARQNERNERHTVLVCSCLHALSSPPTSSIRPPITAHRPPISDHWSLITDHFPILFATPDSVAELRKTILQLAVQGKLRGQSMASGGWRTAALRDVCLQITDGEHATPQRVGEGVPLATAKNVRDGYLDMGNTDFVAPATAQKCWQRCRPAHEDILMVCVGATTGRVCRVQHPPEMVLVRSVALIRPNQDCIAPSFLELCLRSPMGQTQIWDKVKQSAQPCLYLGRMGDLLFPLPPLAEQKRIVAKVNELMALCDALEAKLTQSREDADTLAAAVVHHLCNGVASRAEGAKA